MISRLQFERRRQMRNYALGAALLGFVLILFLVTVARISQSY